MFSSTCVNVKADSEKIGTESELFSTENQCFRAAKISSEQPDLEKIRADQLWNSADVFHIMWSNAEKRQISEKALIISGTSNQKWL